MNGGQPNWTDSFTSHGERFCTGFVKGWCKRANSMNPCTAGWCGLMERSRNGFEPIIGARLGTSSAIAGRNYHLLNNLDENIIRANHERSAQWQAHRTRKQYLEVVWLGHETSAFVDESLPSPAHPLGRETGQLSRLPAFRLWADRVPLLRTIWRSSPLGQSPVIGTSLLARRFLARGGDDID